MSTTTAVDTRRLERALGSVLTLRPSRIKTLAEAIVNGDVCLPSDKLDLPRFNSAPDNGALRGAMFLCWLTGSGMNQQWTDAIVAALRKGIIRITWIADKQELHFKRSH